MVSSGKLVGIVECPSSTTMGSIAGTSVRSSIVVGRRRCVAASAAAGGRASSGTRKREIILLFFLARTLLLVGRAPRVPGCLPIPAPRDPPHRWFSALFASAWHPQRLPTPRVKVLSPELPAFGTQTRAAGPASSR